MKFPSFSRLSCFVANMFFFVVTYTLGGIFCPFEVGKWMDLATFAQEGCCQCRYLIYTFGAEILA